MAGRYTKWFVWGYEREERDHDDTALMHRDTVVVVCEPDEWEWHLVLRAGVVADFRLRGCGSAYRRPVDITALAYVPLADLARIAQVYLDRVAEWGEGHHLDVAMALSELMPGEVRSLDGSPDDEEFARAWHEVGPQAVDGSPRRDALARRFGVSVHAIDKWTKRVRAKRPDLIPPATTGRGNRRRPSPPPSYGQNTEGDANVVNH